MGREEILRSYLEQCLFPQNDVLHCAVSGGADSSALLILASMTGKEVIAHHVDHGLRLSGDAERDLVRGLANKVGARFEAKVLSISDGSNLEARLRDARYEVLPPDVLTGHTADDQAETILMNLMRGGGPDGLAGMTHHRHPIITLRRSDTEAVCEASDWVPFQDPSNQDPRFHRNRVRRELIPMMNRLAQRDVVPLLNRAGKIAEADSAFMKTLAEQIDVTDARALSEAPNALAQRAVRAWLSEKHPPDLASVERVLQVARGEVLGTEIPGGRSIRRTNGKLRMETSSKEHGLPKENG